MARNTRISTKGYFAPFYRGTRQQPHSPLPQCNAQQRATPFQLTFDPFCPGPKKSRHHFINFERQCRREETSYALLSYHIKTATLALSRPINLQRTVSPYGVFEGSLGGRPKIDTLIYKLRATVTSLVDVVRPSIIAHDDIHARLYPVYKAQHRAAQFRSIFGLFCTVLKN